MSAVPINLGLEAAALRVLRLTPAYELMKRDPNLQNWSTELRRFGEREELRPMAGALDYLALNPVDGKTLVAVREALLPHAGTLDWRVLLKASDVAANSPSTPYAGFMLAWASLYLWVLGASQRGETLYDDKHWGGFPHPGWGRIVATSLELAVGLDGLYGARPFAEISWEVLETSRQRDRQDRTVLPHLVRHRKLLQTIDSAHRKAVANLVDDLREACEDRGGRARGLVCALFWSLGLVPESQAAHAAARAPSRRLLTLAVESSIGCLPEDPLLQYLWRELEEIPRLDLHSHRALCMLFDYPWRQWSLDESYESHGFAQPPSRLYVLALESLFTPGSDSRAADNFLRLYDSFDLVRRTLPRQAYISQRFHILRHWIGARFDYYGPEVTQVHLADMMKDNLADVARIRQSVNHAPQVPDMLGRMSHASFSLIESHLADDSKVPSSERDRCALVIEALESFRAAAFTYWLWINPPLPPKGLGADGAQWLEVEKEQLEALRGEYFIMLRPVLPLHFAWSNMDSADSLDLRDPRRRQQFYSPDAASQKVMDIESELRTLATRMQSVAPEYAAQRLNPRADLEQLVELVGRHRRPE